MHSILVASLAGLSCLSSFVSAAPFKFPLSNGFPNIANPSGQLTGIEEAAHGSLPNGAPPASVTSDTLTSLKLIAFNELAEVAFFTELITNITKVEGYYNGEEGAIQTILNALVAVQAQEELHALNANGALKHFNQAPIQPCEYNFPVDNLRDAIALASTFTDVVLGTLQDVESLLATDGDAGLIRGVASVIGQEGEQNGFYRNLLGKIPSALPFLTTSTREFAFSALNQDFVVPRSCPNINTISLPIFKTLNVDTTNIEARQQTLEFSIALDSSISDYTTFSIVYINQQNTPVVEKISNIKVKGDRVTFDANFPFNGATFGNGLTIAALTTSAGPFTSADAVAKVTYAGPGLIEIN
jgi:Ferritin-like domain